MQNSAQNLISCFAKLRKFRPNFDFVFCEIIGKHEIKNFATFKISRNYENENFRSHPKPNSERKSGIWLESVKLESSSLEGTYVDHWVIPCTCTPSPPRYHSVEISRVELFFYYRFEPWGTLDISSLILHRFMQRNRGKVDEAQSVVIL